jgi:hypothetical protein
MMQRSLTFKNILERKEEPTISAIVSKGKINQYIPVMASFSMTSLKTIFNSDMAELLATEFVLDVIDIEPTWKVLDVLHFWKWIRTNDGIKVFGQVNIKMLHEFRCKYNEEQALNREQLHKQSQNNYPIEAGTGKDLHTLNNHLKNENKLKIEFGRKAEAASEQGARKPISQEKRQSHQDFFENNI